MLSAAGASRDSGERGEGCRADSDSNGGNSTRIVATIVGADDFGVGALGGSRGDILGGLGLGRDGREARCGCGGGVAVCACGVLLQELLASLSGWNVYGHGILFVCGRSSGGCPFVCRISGLLRFVANVAILIIVVHVVRILALVIAVDAVVEVAEVAELALLGHVVRHGLVARVGLPAGERSGARVWSARWERAAGLRRVRTHAAGRASLCHGRCRYGGGQCRDEGDDGVTHCVETEEWN